MILLRLDNVNHKDLSAFLQSLTKKEMRYYNIYEDKIIETNFFMKGFYDDDRLVAVGGLAKWYRLFPHAFYMIKEEYQGRGIGTKFSELNLQYAIKKDMPFIFGSAKLDNIRSIKIITKLGYKKVWADNENYYSILLLKPNWAFVKVFLKIVLPIYSTPLGNWIKVLKKNKRLGL